MSGNCRFNIVFPKPKNAQTCALEKFINKYYKNLSPNYLGTLGTLNNSQYSYFMTTIPTNNNPPFQVYANNYNTTISYSSQPPTPPTTTPIIIPYSNPSGSQISYSSIIVFTTNGSFTVNNITPDININIWMIGGGGGGGGGGGQVYLAGCCGGAGGGGGNGYLFSGTITQNGTYNVTVGQGGKGGAGGGGAASNNSGVSGQNGGTSSITSSNGFSLTAGGGSGGGYGGGGNQNVYHSDGGSGGAPNGGPGDYSDGVDGPNGGGGGGGNIDTTNYNGIVPSTTFNVTLYLGGGGAGGSNQEQNSGTGLPTFYTAGSPNASGCPQTFTLDYYSPPATVTLYAGTGGVNEVSYKTGSPTSAGFPGCNAVTSNYLYAGGGGGGGAGSIGSAGGGGTGGNNGGNGANGVVVIYW